MCNKRNSTQKIVVKLLQQLVTEFTDRVPATQPCTLNNWLQSVPTRYRLHSLVQLLQQLVIECTDRVPATQQCKSYPAQPVTESSDPVLYSNFMTLGGHSSNYINSLRSP